MIQFKPSDFHLMAAVSMRGIRLNHLDGAKINTIFISLYKYYNIYR